MKKKLTNFAVFVLCFQATAQITNYNIQSEKTYPDGTRTCYFEIDDNLTREQKGVAMQQAQGNKNILDLYFYEDNKNLAMFCSAIAWNVDSIVNFINNAVLQYSVQNIADEVGNSSEPNRAPQDNNCSGSLSQPNGCIDAEPFCTNDSYCFAAATQESVYGRVGCLGSTPGPAWYWMEIDQPGDLVMHIEQASPAGAPRDVDFICWGPFNSVAEACAQKQMAGGNSCHTTGCGYPIGNIVDCCFCSLDIEDVYIYGAQTGQVYLLLLTNYSRQEANISFSKTGGTATTNCGIITPPASNNGPLCVGDTLQLSAQTSNTAGAIYNWTGPNGFTSTQQNPVINNVTTANAGTYTLIVTTATEIGTPETTEVIINVPSDTTFINDTICQNLLPYTQNGFNAYITGEHILNLKNINNCDSIVVLNLVINPISIFEYSDTICIGENYEFVGNFYNQTGTYIDTLPNAFGCDSIITLNLLVADTFNIRLDTVICAGGSVLFNGVYYSQTIFISDTLTTIHGCDSIINLNLCIMPVYNDTIRDTICAGGNYNLHNFNLINVQNSIIQTHTEQTGFSCDSLFTLDLFVNSVFRDTIYEQICEGQVYNFYGVDYSATGIYPKNFTTQAGCDSIEYLNLTINNLIRITRNETICATRSYNFYGAILTQAGRYIDTIAGANCDTIVTLNLAVTPLFTKNINTTICKLDSYIFHGTILTNAGTYIDTIAGAYCDTIVTLNLITKPCSEMEIMQLSELCADDKHIELNYNILRGDLVCYYVTFDSRAADAGFLDIDCQNPVQNGRIEIPIPQFAAPSYVRPNYYSMDIKFEFTDGGEHIFKVEFPILYPHWVINQKWNNVLALLNEYYNGGYTFSRYEWLKNGVKIAGENYSYIYLGERNSFDFISEYRALLTRQDDGVTMLTCPIVPEMHTDNSYFPTLVGAGQPIMFHVKAKATATFISISGINLGKHQLSESENYINAPIVSGFYIIKIEVAGKEPITQILIVK